MNILIIPSAKLINEQLQSQFGEIPNVLIPLGNKVIIEHLYEKYYEKFDKIYIIGFEKVELISKFLKNKKLDIELIILDKLLDLGYTVYYSLNVLLKKHENINNFTVNFGDTLFEEEPIINKDVFFYSSTKDSKRWTTFEFDQINKLSIVDKEKIENKQQYNSFIGYFNFSNCKGLKKIFDYIYNENKKFKKDNFYEVIERYDNKFEFNTRKTEKWIDVGHLDKYFEGKKDVKSRYFNTIKIDKQRGILTKYSKNKSKFINEIKWYLKLPNKLQYIAPRIYDYSIEYNKPYITMEYYCYNTLHEIYIHGEYSGNQWSVIFDSLFSIINDMCKYKVQLERDEMYQTLEEIYLNKTINRLEKLKLDKKFNIFFNNNIIINNSEFRSINYYIKLLPILIRKLKLYDLSELNIIHGDFCLTNILYDCKCNLVRLIDPRGEFGKFDIYGDVRYEYAKLSHSIEGKYDLIIEDLFNVEVIGNKIQYEVFANEKHKTIEKVFLRKINELGIEYQAIKLIEGILFLSMIPLHKDNLKRQYVMLATGIKLLNQVESHIDKEIMI